MALCVSDSADMILLVTEADYFAVLSASTDRTLLLGELPR
jgi:hypothetical protein